GPGGSTGSKPAAMNKVAGDAANKASARRNLANTYVWTAAGGLFSETTASTDQVTYVNTGNYSVKGSATIGGSNSFDIGPVSVKMSGEATLGGGYTYTRTKTQQATRGFSLGIACQPNANLQQQGASGPVLDAGGNPVLVPGRVDAYRFMSFYL